MIEYVALVNKGLVHTTCDDSILVGHNVISNGKLMGCEDRDEGVFAVADGVGGLPFSELASREILRNIAECNARNKEEIINCVEKGNEKILSIRNQRKLFPNISSTLCIVALLEDEITTYNLGNSRAYRFRDGVLFFVEGVERVIEYRDGVSRFGNYLFVRENDRLCEWWFALS